MEVAPEIGDPRREPVGFGVSIQPLQPLLAAEVDPAERLRALIAVGLLAMQEMPLLSSLSGGDHELGLALSEVDASVLARIDGWRVEFMMGLIDEATTRTLTREALLERAQVLIDVISGVVLSGALSQKGAGLEQYAWTLAGILVGGIATTSTPLRIPASWLPRIDAAVDPTADAPITKEAAL